MRSARPLAVALLLCLATPFVGCGDKKSSGSAGFKNPDALIEALRIAVLSGDAATARGLYDTNDPAAATKTAFWTALSGRSKRWAEVRAAYIGKFGPRAWSAPGNPFDVTYSQRDLGLDASLSEYFSEAKARIEGDRATVAAGKFQFTINRRDGAWRTFREASFGLTAEEAKGLDEDVDRAKAALEVIAAATTPAEVRISPPR